jgi:hypothetical protein
MFWKILWYYMINLEGLTWAQARERAIAKAPSLRNREEISARDATIDRWRTRAEAAERNLVVLRDVLASIERNDKTPKYLINRDRSSQSSQVANCNGEYPASGERWATPREIARGALDKIK